MRRRDVTLGGESDVSSTRVEFPPLPCEMKVHVGPLLGGCFAQFLIWRDVYAMALSDRRNSRHGPSSLAVSAVSGDAWLGWEGVLRAAFPESYSAFFGLDVIVSSLALWLLVFSEGRRRGMRNLWLYVVCNLTVGVSLALPLFLFFRERKLNDEKYA